MDTTLGRARSDTSSSSFSSGFSNVRSIHGGAPDGRATGSGSTTVGWTGTVFSGRLTEREASGLEESFGEIPETVNGLRAYAGGAVTRPVSPRGSSNEGAFTGTGSES